ncbi:flagellar export protein FliJ [Brevibacillus sp. SYP-B805]|uniref:flagellar export protein FliJ n=1 Tax=Brevibacillus sp. SYP-B805 TaxID=1578199 RepID=UPI0013EC0670|nr:flagellar export protein FliJ [Brevibacillus sp. SYP-B805]NGQ94009.1 flagellar export protein FliJ [Brevibacillus sp. SYP-B805]
MKTFHFHLQKVLDLKEREKEQAAWALGKSMQRQREEEEKLYQLNERREELTQFLYEVQVQACTAARLIDITRYRQAVDKAILSQQRTLHGCEQEVEARKQTLTRKMQETQLWQRLREKAMERFHNELGKREQKELDEIGINRYVRRSH